MFHTATFVLALLLSPCLSLSAANQGSAIAFQEARFEDASTPTGSLSSSWSTGSQTSMTTTPPAPMNNSGCDAGTTIHAQNANLIYWDTYVHTWAMSRGFCNRSGPAMIDRPVWITGSFNFDSGTTQTYSAASTVVANVTTPTVTSTETRTWTVFSAISGMSPEAPIATYTSTMTDTSDFYADGYHPQLSEITATIKPTGKAALTITAATPLIYYAEIGLEKATSVNGSCLRSIATTTLETPFAGKFTGDPLTSWAGRSAASGLMPSDAVKSIFQALNVSNGIAGTYRGLPTIAVASFSAYYFRCLIAKPHQHLTPAPTLLPNPGPSSQLSEHLRNEFSTSAASPSFFLTPEPGLLATNVKTAQATAPLVVPAPSSLALPQVTNPVNDLPDGPVGQSLSPLITIVSQTVFANPQSNLIINSQTLAPGDAITIAGKKFELGPSGHNIVVDGTSTVAVPSSLGNHVAPAVGEKAPHSNGLVLPTTITLFNTPLTLDPASPTPVIVDGQTITPGGPAITVSGTRISLDASDSAIIVGSTTSLLGNQRTVPLAVTFGGSLLTENSNSAFAIGSQTLAPGSAITVDGTILSLAPGASDIVIGSSTINLEGSQTETTPVAPTGRGKGVSSRVGSDGGRLYPAAPFQIGTLSALLGLTFLVLI